MSALRPPSVRALESAVDRLAPEVSVSRLGQLHMVVRMWERALVVWPKGRRRPTGDVRGMFAPPGLEAFWELAVAGELRKLGQDRGELPVASQRVVRDCLGILAQEVAPGMAVVLPVVEQQVPKGMVPPRQLPVLYRRLADMASDAPVERGDVALSFEDRVRLLAIVAVVLDTGARSSELAGQRLADLGEGLGSLVVRRQPQNAAGGPVREVCVLRDGTRVALRRWLGVREGLVAPLEGAKSALWVSLTANQWQAQPGFPLRAQGIRKAYWRGMVALNMLMAGRTGWEPLPTTLEQLRRAVEAEAAAAGGAGG